MSPCWSCHSTKSLGIATNIYRPVRRTWFGKRTRRTTRTHLRSRSTAGVARAMGRHSDDSAAHVYCVRSRHEAGAGMRIERRQGERRNGDRRSTPGAAIDVTRIEHENLYGQVEEILRVIRRVENDLRNVGERLGRVESDVDLMARSNAG